MLEVLPISYLKGVGPQWVDVLRQMHITTVQDLLFYFPLRYEDRTRITPLNHLTAGARVVIEGRVVRGHIQYGQRRSLVLQLQDNTGEIFLRFFHFTPQQFRALTQPGTWLHCFGEVRPRYTGQGFEMVHPQYGHNKGLLSDSLTPIYGCGAKIQQATWRKLVQQSLRLWDQEPELTPLLPSLKHALHTVHNPPADADVEALLAGTHPSQQCLALEELVAQQLSVIEFRNAVQQQPAPVLSAGAMSQKLVDCLPFTLTAAQTRVLQEINTDLAKNKPMLRLLQGDVGSGKTIIAALALLRAVDNKKQGALMVPTELLAEQHTQSLKKWCEPLGVRIGQLHGSLNRGAREHMLHALQEHTIDIIVGTHALFQESVQCADVALVVIDEQHRFGVEQRLAFKQKAIYGSYHPHQLLMTATPIPRTLAMSVYANLDLSTIDELPPGRQPVTTLLISNQKRHTVIERVRAHCAAGHQAYWVCTLIEESEALRAEAAEVRYHHLAEVLPQLRIALIHGRLKSDLKEATMAAFKAGNIDLLVATTVIEVGVHVSNASLMMIENAERLGLAQLHQLRGRIGRGEHPSFCVLLYQSPLSALAQNRLRLLRDYHDGFYIAEQDLQMRGPGEVLGTRQTGMLRLKIADLLRDAHLLSEAKRISAQIAAECPHVIPALIRRWLLDTEAYGTV